MASTILGDRQTPPDVISSVPLTRRLLMSISFWNPPVPCTRAEERILKLCRRTRKLYVFLREHRHEIVDLPMHEKLAAMYRTTGAGKPPLPPGLLAMATIMQGYQRVSDAEAVQMAQVDLRWQTVLGCLGTEDAPLSQGALCEFRQRLIEHDMDRRLLAKTAEVARRCGGFDPSKLPQDLPFAVDSAPLSGAGRVEDTINLLGHAARKVVECAAELTGRDKAELSQEAGIPVLLASSVKCGLDREWTAPGERQAAVADLVGQVDSLLAWVKRELLEQMARPPLAERLSTLQQLMEQDLEPDPDGRGPRVRQGVAPERQISIEDPEMRHGRKSKSRTVNGYKAHVMVELATRIIDGCVATPANRPEAEAFASLEREVREEGLSIGALRIDRGYVSSPEVQALAASGVDVVCRPWRVANGELYSKAEFDIDLAAGTVRCPGGQVGTGWPGETVEFDAGVCDACQLRSRCIRAAAGCGRSVKIAKDEALQQAWRKAAKTKEGRDRLRERVPVEHVLAHMVVLHGGRARYRGTRKTLFELRRSCSVVNLQTAHRLLARAA